MTLRGLWQHWRNFFFTPQSPMPVCVFRIFLGLIVLHTAVFQLWPDFLLYYGNNAALSVNAEIATNWKSNPMFDLFLLLPDDHSKYILLVVMIVASITLTIGLFSRASSLTVFLILLSMYHHCPGNLNAGDGMMRLTSLFLACSAPGAALSVDSLIKNFRRDWQKEGTLPEPVSPWGQRMLQLQLAIAYWETFFGKLGGTQWVDGSAVYIVMRDKEFFTGFPILPFMESALVCRLLCWYTLVVEFSLAVLVWFKELRYFILLNGLVLHLSIAYMMNLGLFEEMFVAVYVVFIEPEDLQKALDKTQSYLAGKLPPSKKTLIFDQQCPFCLSWAGTFHRLDYFKRLRLDENGQSGSHLTLRSNESDVHGMAALRSICAAIPQLWICLPLLFFPGAEALWNSKHATAGESQNC